MMDPNEGPQPEIHADVYPFTAWMRALYLLFATLALAAAVYLAMHAAGLNLAERIWRWAEAAALALSAAYLLLGAFVSCVLFAGDFVAVRGVFFTSSLPRRSISSYSIGRSTGLKSFVFYPDPPESQALIVPRCYRFDKAWADWIDSLMRLPSV